MKLIDFKNAVLKFLSDSRVNSDSSVFNSSVTITARSSKEGHREVARLAISSETQRIYLIVGLDKNGAMVSLFKKVFGFMPIPMEDTPMLKLRKMCESKSKYDDYDIFIAWFHIWKDMDMFDYVAADRLIDNDYQPKKGMSWLCFDEDRDKKSQKTNSYKLDEEENVGLDNLFKPNEEWMAQKYDEMNKKLFDGRLGKCHFGIFTTGKGSMGNTLGYFTMDRRGLMMMGDGSIFVSTPGSTISLYSGTSWNSPHKWINYENFYDECNPTIKLNGNYSGNEFSFLMTLVHEMCHYYNYMTGKAPKQAHGPEFRSIAARVQAKSGGEIKIERIATAEQIEGMKLDAEIQARIDKKRNNMMNGAMAIIVFEKDGTVKLTMTKSKPLMREIVEKSRDRENCSKIAVSVNNDVNKFLVGKGYRKLQRTWRFWRLTNEPWLQDFLDNILPEESYVYGTKFDGALDECFIEEADDTESVEIPAGMNLGLESPLEMLN